MKKGILVIVATFILYAGFSQPGSDYQAAHDSMSKVVIHYLQEKQPDSIYYLAGENFKSTLSQKEFKSVIEGQVFPLNNFQEVTFVSSANGINKYKVSGTPVLQLLIGLDKSAK